MSQCASHYPISILLARIMGEAGQSRSEFIQAVGHRNIQHGRRRLDSWLEDGIGYERILKQIVAAYPALADELEKAIAATRAMKAAEADSTLLELCKAEQGTFIPFIHVEGETIVPNGITLFGVTGGKWNLIEVPQHILDLPLADQTSALADLMRAYLRKYNGVCPFFGKVTGFLFVRCLDYFRFDHDGQFVQHVDKPFRRGHAFCSLL